MTSDTSRLALASVVIPAHNEALVIRRCLDALAGEGGGEDLEIVVVCNGCTDNTADVVRSAYPLVRVVELDQASKTAALNAGDAASNAFPRFFVDADVELGSAAVRRVSEMLAHDETLCAAPVPKFAITGRRWAIRAFYGIWSQLPYLNDDMVGSGVYAVSARGRSRFGRFPALTADDQYVMQLFSHGERRSCPDVSFLIHPPTSLTGLLNMRARAYRGNRELARSGLIRHPPTGGAGRALARLARSPANWPGLAVYVGVNMLARLRSEPSGGWERDDSARVSA